MDLRKLERLPPSVLQLFGMLGLALMGIFWAFTNRLSPALLATAGSMVGAGTYVEAIKSLPEVVRNGPKRSQDG